MGSNGAAQASRMASMRNQNCPNVRKVIETICGTSLIRKLAHAHSCRNTANTEYSHTQCARMKRRRAHGDSDVTVLRSPDARPDVQRQELLKLWCAQSLSRSRLTALNKLVGWQYPFHLQQRRNRSRLRLTQCRARQCRFEPTT